MSPVDILVICASLMLAAILLPTAPVTRVVLYLVLIGLIALPSILSTIDAVRAMLD